MQLNRWLLSLRTRLSRAEPSRIAVYGAGSHTRKYLAHLKKWLNEYNHEFIALIDDSPAISAMDGIPVVKSDNFDGSTVDLLIISSDSFESSIWQSAIKRFPDKKSNIWRIYSSFPNLDPSGLIPATQKPGGDNKIAVVDMIFGWPPDGGARRDLYEICSRLATKAHVRLFVPSLCDGGLIRGAVSEALPFEVQLVPCAPHEFKAGIIDKRIRSLVDKFQADQVFIGDAYHLKPVLVKTFADYKPVVRFYAYETMCLKGSGELYRDGKACHSSWAADGNSDAWFNCLACSMDFYVAAGGCRFFRDEALGSGALDSSYPDLVAEAYGSASALICYNDTMAELLRKFSNNVHIIPSGVDTETFTPAGITPAATNFLMSGRVNDERKGFCWLTDACDKLAEDGSQFSLMTTGTMTGKSLPYQKDLGWIENDRQLAENLAGASVCIVPSLWPEALGMVALEAMACGIPVIASRTGGLGNIFTDGKEGFYVDPHDIDAMAEKLRYFINNPDARDKMGANGRRLVCENYRWDDIAEKHIFPLFNLAMESKV